MPARKRGDGVLASERVFYLDAVSVATQRAVRCALRLNPQRVYVSGDRLSVDRHALWDPNEYWLIEPWGECFHYWRVAGVSRYRMERTGINGQ